MTAQELRIGNWINDLTGYECQVRGTTSNGIWIHDVGGPGTEAAFSPIPLTPEWLERFGFEMDDSLNQGILNGHWFLGNEVDYKSWYLIRRDTNAIIKRHVTTVHQLQNLYFALTCQELELK